MKWELNIHTTMLIPRWAMKILGSYPIPKDSGRGAYLIQQFCWWFCIINGIHGGTWIGYNMVKRTSTIDEILTSVPEMTLLMSQLGKQLVCKLYDDELRDVLDEFDRFLREAPAALIDRLHRELRVVYIVHAFFIFGCIADPLMFTLTPLMDGRLLPAHISFPWSLNSTAIYTSLYVNEVLGAVTVSCMANMDPLFATLIWGAAIRFRNLNSQMTHVEEMMDTRKCAAEQQQLIKSVARICIAYSHFGAHPNFVPLRGPSRKRRCSLTSAPLTLAPMHLFTFFRLTSWDRYFQALVTGYTEDLANVARWMAFVIVVAIFCMVTTGGVLLLRKPPMHEVLFYAILTICGSLELMLYCWAADNLYEASRDLALAAFQSNWYGKSKGMILDLRLIIQRCQQPITISSPPILPVLSREFFGTIMSSTFSYIATMRAVFDSQ